MALNGNVFYQMFCDIVIDPAHPLTNYKLLDDIALWLAGKLKTQELKNRLAEAWKPYMKDLDTMFTDATCYESDMRYPTDQKLLWECIEKAYALMCEESQRLGLHRPRTKFLDVEKANLAYRKQRRCAREHPGSDSEREQAVCEAHRVGQGSEERGVWGQVQQHPGGWDIVH